MRHYATACRGWQLPVLLASMRKYCRPFTLHVLAWDFDAHDEEFLGPDVWITPRAALLRLHPHLEPSLLPGPPRSAVDTVVTMRWRHFHDVMLYTGAPITAVDGDMWFWSSPGEVFAEIGVASMAVTPHGIPRASFGHPGVTLETHRRYGLFNGGWVYMADPGIADEMALLNREWSYTEVHERLTGGWDFGDQGHLERVALRRRAHVINHPGVNAAPWNIHGRRVELVDGVVQVGRRPLIAFHYSSFRPGEKIADPSYAITPEQGRILYEPYIEEVDRWTSRNASSS